jgi:conjugal transfer pilus assembly protein TraW
MRKIIIFITIILAIGMHGEALAKDLGKYGATYPIIEEDAISQMKKAIARYDWEKFKIKQKEKIKNFKPKDLVDLPVAKEDKVFKVDMTGAIKEDIIGRDGEVIYPKGYKYNPMEYVFMRRIIVFINGKDEKQIEWYKKSPYPADMRTMLLITDGSYLDVRKKLNTMTVYYANKEIIERMGIKAVPSVAVQKGTELEVQEYALKKEK